MLNKYRRYDIIGLLRDYNYNRGIVAEWKRKLEEMSELPALHNEAGVRSGSISDTTARQVIEREKIQSSINSYERDLNAVERALGVLNEEEKQVLKLLCIEGLPLDSVCHSLAREKTKIYDLRNSGIARLQEILYQE